PLSRTSLLVGKFFGAWLAATLMSCVSVTLVAAVLLGSDHFADVSVWVTRLPRVWGVLALGGLTYRAPFTFGGPLLARPALVRLGLGFGGETAIPFLPGSLRLLTVRHHLSAFLPSELLPSALRIVLSPPSVPEALAWLTLGAALFMTSAAMLFARRDYP